jgi:hypothetical protein
MNGMKIFRYKHVKGIKLLFLISGIVMLLIISTCYYDSEEFLYPQFGACDTTHVTFAGSVKPILQNNCYQCHSNTTYPSGNNIKLEDYADVKVSADNGSLYGSVNHSGGYSPMPKFSPKLADCNITIIKKWVDSGALNK